MEFEPGISNDYLPMDPKRLLERLHTALNTRDLTNLLHCLQVDFEQIHPARPGTDTTGLEAARAEWDAIFDAYPDFRADLLRQAIEGNTIWTEWHWFGKQAGGQTGSLNRVGVIVYGVEEGLLAWGREYMVDTAEQSG
jgi:limonene-1,2-epoxide hydrolase